MAELPIELWLRIAQFIPDQDLFRLASVSQLFFDFAEDRKYRELVIDDDRPEVLMPKLMKLQQDPITAGRVRSLEIHPKAIRSAWLRSPKSAKRTKGCWYFYPYLNLWKSTPTTNSSFSIPAAFLSTISSPNININSYTISWPHSLPDELPFCLPILTSLWAAIDAPYNLRVLQIDMGLEHLGSLLAQMPRFEKLQELTLRFTTEEELGPGVPIQIPAPGVGPSVPTSSEDVARQRFATTITSSVSNGAFLVLSKFILSLSSTIVSLTLSSTSSNSSSPSESQCHVDFSHLFNHLANCDDHAEDIYSSSSEKDISLNTVPLPNLTSLTLRIPIDPAHLPDPSGFNAFLKAQGAVLECLTFEPTFSCSAPRSPIGLGVSGPHARYEEHVRESRWLDAVFDGVSFLALRSLHVGISAEQAQVPSPHANLCWNSGSKSNRVMPIVQRLCQAVATSTREKNLSGLKLSIEGCIISLDDLCTVLLTFSSSSSPSSGYDIPDDEEVYEHGGTLTSTRTEKANNFFSHSSFLLRQFSHSLANPRGEARQAAPAANPPRILTLQVHVLNVPLLDLLAELLPGLEELDLMYNWIGKAGGRTSGDAVEFTDQLRGKRYRSWKLSRLVVRCSRLEGDEERWACQRAIVGCVPGISQ